MKRFIITLAAVLALAPAARIAAQNHPHFTDKTVKVHVNEGTTVEAISDGVITLKDKDGKFAFYDTREDKFLAGKFDWSSSDGGSWGPAPYFSGACAATRLEGPNSWDVTATFFIIHRDGAVYQLPGSVRKMSAFADGICVIQREKKVGKSTMTAYSYMDANYKEVLKGFVPTDCTKELKVKKISDGMRAVLDGATGLWGYVDETGRTVIAPKFADAGNFSEGLAIATTSSSYDKKYGIIDKTGNFVVAETFDIGYSDQEIPEFHGGFAYLVSARRFIDKKGQLWGEGISAATPVNGKDKVLANLEDEYESSFVIDNDFEKKIKLGHAYTLNSGYGKPVQWKGGCALVKTGDGKAVLVSEGGAPVLEQEELKDSWLDQSELKDWDGKYATLMFRFTEDAQHPAYCDAAGDLVHVFCPVAGAKDEDEPEITILTDEKEHATINVVAYPPEAAKCYGSGQFERGEYRQVMAVPVNDQWEWAEWRCEDEKVLKTLNENFGLYVDKDITITAVFVKKAELTSTLKPALAADADIDNIYWRMTRDHEVETFPAHIYLRIDNERKMTTAYGDNQLGIFCVTFPKGYRMTTEIGINDKYTVLRDFCSPFFAPMKVEGFDREGTKTYIRLTGGLRTYGNLTEDNDSEMVEGAKQWIYLFGGGKQKSCYNGTNIHDFRLEYTDNGDGTVTLGEMQMFAPGIGWTDPDSKEIPRYKAYDLLVVKLAARVEGYFGKNLFKGVVLKPAVEEKVEYLPEDCWFKGYDTDEKDKESIMKSYNGEVPTALYARRLKYKEVWEKVKLTIQ